MAIIESTTSPTEGIVYYDASTGSKLYAIPPWDDKDVAWVTTPPKEEIKTTTLASRTRVNKKTLARDPPSQVVEKVKAKLAKDLLDQLVAGNVIKIESVCSPTNGSVTFTASLEVVQHNATPTKA